MKLVLHPPVESERLAAVVEAAGPMRVLNGVSAPEEMRDADGFFGKITPELLARAPRLRWVQSPTASLEHYIFPELVSHACTLTNMRGLFSDVIADQVMGYLICFTRNLHRYVLQQARGVWSPVGGETGRVNFATGPGVVNDIDRRHPHLGDLTAGIVGLGAIGSEIARRALAFSLRVLAVDPVPRNQPGVDVWPLDRLPDLLGQSDFVIIAAPHTPRTTRMIARPQLRQMKPSAYLVNIGRGAIVSLDDLVAALEANEIAGAALDVFETEPLPPSSPLWGMGDRAGYSPRIAGRHLGILLDNVRRFARGEALVNVVNKAEWF